MDVPDASQDEHWVATTRQFEDAAKQARAQKGRIPPAHLPVQLQVAMFNTATHAKAAKAAAGDRFALATTCMPPTYPPCVLPADELDPIMISEMRLETQHRGRRALVRRPTTTLESFLLEGARDEDARFTSKEQTLLALDIASSILQLCQTCWHNKPLDSQRIKLLLVPPRPANKTAATSQITGANVVGPFVEKLLVLRKNGEATTAGHATTDKADQKGRGKAAFSAEQEQQEEAEGPSPKAALLELAILLLEIWHHRRLKTWVDKARMVDTDTSRPRADRWPLSAGSRGPPRGCRLTTSPLWSSAWPFAPAACACGRRTSFGDSFARTSSSRSRRAARRASRQPVIDISCATCMFGRQEAGERLNVPAPHRLRGGLHKAALREAWDHVGRQDGRALDARGDRRRRGVFCTESGRRDGREPRVEGDAGLEVARARPPR